MPRHRTEAPASAGYVAVGLGALLLVAFAAARGGGATEPSPTVDGWTQWWGGGGREEAPQECPPGAFLSHFDRMDCAGMLRGIAGVCTDGTRLALAGRRGRHNASLAAPQPAISLRWCAAVDQLLACGNRRGGDPGLPQCAAGGGIAGYQARVGSWMGTAIKAVRFRCRPVLPPAARAGPPPLAHATFSLGCFWAARRAFADLPGVRGVEMGYTGGFTPHPTQAQVAQGATGHAEAVRVTYDPARSSYALLLRAFWGAHDPTQRHGQGKDIGTQFRSAVWAHTTEQRAEAKKAAAERRGATTEVAAAGLFYVAPAPERHCAGGGRKGA